MSESELEFCKKAYETEMNNSGYGLYEHNLSDSAKRYQNWLQRHNAIDPKYDCIAITIGLLISVTFYWLVFYDATIDHVGSFVVKLIIFLIADIVLGALLGDVSSLLVQKFYKKHQKNSKYWLICLVCSISFVLFAILLFVYYKPENSSY